MSQAKVDQHKELKKNRKKIVKRKKITNFAYRVLGTVIIVAAVGFIGYSGYGVYQDAHADDPLPSTEIDTSAVTDYYDTISVDDSE